MVGTSRVKLILVADDSPASRELIRETLETDDRRVVEARDGRQALEMIRESLPDLVLMDIQMPYFDGYSVLEKLRSDSRFEALRVIAVTAYAMHGDREKALSAGFDGYITKPIQIGDLRAQVDRFLEIEPGK